MRARWRRLCALSSCSAALGLPLACKPGCAAGEGSGTAEPPRTGTPSSGLAWAAPIEVATGDAYRGPWRMNESEFFYVDDPTVALTRDGLSAIGWADNRRKDVFFRLYEAGGEGRLEAPVNVSRSPDTFSWLPRVTISPNGAEVFMLWQEIIFSGGSHGGEILFARSGDGGRSFDEPKNLSNTIAGDGKGRLTSEHWHNGSLDLALGPDGALFAAWTEYEGALWVSRSSDGGRTFSAPLQVSGTRSRPARGPSLATGRGGLLFLAWTLGEDPKADIHVARSADAARSFDPSWIPFESDGHSDAPKIALDGRGRLHLVHAEGPSGPSGPYHVRYARLEGNGQVSRAPITLSGSPRRREAASFPSLALDGNDRVYVVWEHYPDSSERPRGLGFSHSRDGGEQFTPPSIVPGTADASLGHNGGLQGLLTRKLTANAAGDIGIAHSWFAPGERSRVALLRARVR